MVTSFSFPFFFIRMDWVNTGEVDVTTVKMLSHCRKQNNIIMPLITFLHIPLTFCQIDYGFNIKRLHDVFFIVFFQMRYYKSILHAQGISIWGLRLWGRAVLVSRASSVQLNCSNNWRPRRWTRRSPLQRIMKRVEANVYVSAEAGESARFPSDGSPVFYFSHFPHFL